MFYQDQLLLVAGIANGPTSRGGIGEGVNLGGSSGVTKNTRSKKIPFLCISQRVGYD